MTFLGRNEINKKKKGQNDWTEDINFHTVLEFECLLKFVESTKLTVLIFQYLCANNK